MGKEAIREVSPLEERRGVVAFLQNYNYTRVRIYDYSDYDALIKMIDFERALLHSNLSEMELMAIIKVFIQDNMQVEFAEEMGVTKQTVQKWIERGTGKIAKHYKDAGVLDG